MKYKTKETPEFVKWYEKQELLVKAKISSRLNHLKQYGYMGVSRCIDSNLFELKWRIGIRLYFSFFNNEIILLLLGGKKNDQKKDIKKAKKIKERYC